MESLVSFITYPVTSGILLLIFFSSIVYQVFSERINVSTLLAIISISVYYIGHFFNGGFTFMSLALLFFGVILLTLEFFVIGLILGAIGLAMIIFSMIMVTTDPTVYGIVLLIVLVITVIEVGVFIKMKKKRVPLWKRLILTDATDTESGYTSFDDRGYLVGEVGVTVTPLRPSGTVLIDDKRIDAVADGTFINANVDVKVVYVEGTRIVVRPVN
ncbi:hypothetical protein GCM10007358_03730 [Phocicoccus schoeneichii]|uniref:Uncharacterized protein n=1 Tax=Phocicoccus schoeneichii TaxID=1812261 RepID=A0A6V7RG63_9BACL|nr:NfeD family protein [Jeotgalicoccus schoeneichii]GGH48320.1 hypothetical protein GCM10007358_03730 [Jeotgalicoccus schoeneichii]CAD2076919.1 hypothetical protein JEOSCH030_01179 [Jeotgalicoccus schoeneichii]